MSRFESRNRLQLQIASTLLVAGALATAIGVASASGAPHVHAKNVVITSVKSTKFGTILTDGTTLYTLKPNATSCTATCHKYWIPVDLPKGDTKAVAGSGVSAVKLGTVKVKGGRQVTYGAQGALLVLRGQVSRSGEGERHRHVGQVGRRRSREAREQARDDHDHDEGHDDDDTRGTFTHHDSAHADDDASDDDDDRTEWRRRSRVLTNDANTLPRGLRLLPVGTRPDVTDVNAGKHGAH